MNRGITIIELLVVVAILSTLGIMSTSFYSQFLTRNSTDVTRDQLAASFRKAQIYSMTGKQNGAWGVKYTSSLNKITLYLTGNSGFDESFTVNSNITVNGFADISFARITGLPNSTANITISGGTSNKTISINSQGVVSKTN